MTLANAAGLRLLFIALGCCTLVLATGCQERRGLPSPVRTYGPTTPGGYYIRVTPLQLTMFHNQRPRLTVRVEDAAGHPVDDVPVRFVPSEGTVTPARPRTHGGVVTVTFTAATGSDSPRTASIQVTVEDVAVTVFIDIVPAVFGR